MDSFLFSLESVFPLFALIALGYFLGQKGFITKGFTSAGTKLVFNFCLPVLLFRQISAANLSDVFNIKLIGFSLITTLLVLFLLILLVPRFIKGDPQRGAYIQGVYRGNFSILGVPLAISMFGTEGAAPASLLLPFTVPLYNVAAVIVLTIYGPKENTKKGPSVGSILKGIVTNPLIIGIVLALPFSLLHWSLPKFLDKTLADLSSMTTPLALICLGAGFDFKQSKKQLSLGLSATFLKLILIPVIVVGAAIAMGFRGGELGAIFIQIMAHSAVSSYIMAKNMHSDDALAGQILIYTTIASCITLFAGIYLLRSWGLI